MKLHRNELKGSDKHKVINEKYTGFKLMYFSLVNMWNFRFIKCWLGNPAVLPQGGEPLPVFVQLIHGLYLQ